MQLLPMLPVGAIFFDLLPVGLGFGGQQDGSGMGICS